MANKFYWFFQNPLIDSVLVVVKVSCEMCALEAIKTSEFEFSSSVPGCQSMSCQESETTISICSYFCLVVTLTVHISTFSCHRLLYTCRNVHQFRFWNEKWSSQTSHSWHILPRHVKRYPSACGINVLSYLIAYGTTVLKTRTYAFANV